MLAIINIIVAIGLTILYALNQSTQLNFIGILTIIAAFLVSFILVMLVLILFSFCLFMPLKKQVKKHYGNIKLYIFILCIYLDSYIELESSLREKKIYQIIKTLLFTQII